MSHIIQRQTVRLHLREQSDNWAVQEKVGRVFQQAGLLAELDAVLSDFSSADEWIELERVEVDLGSIAPDGFEAEIARRLPDLLRRQLIEVISETRFYAETSVRKTGEVVFETFIYFLQTGLLPATTLWPESSPGFEEQIQAVLLQLNGDQKERLKAVLSQSIPRTRLLTQFSDEILNAVFQVLSANPKSVSVRLWQRLQTIREKLTANQYQTLWTMLFEKTVLKSETALQTIENRWNSLNPSDLASYSEMEWLLNGFEKPDFESANTVQNESDSEKPPVLNESERGRFETDKTVRKNLDLGLKTPTEPPTDAVFYIRNAGVVLLHPFLSFCFEACGWTENSVFKAEECREKALTMIHFLATGEPQSAEYDLLLPKILCDMRWNSPVSSRYELTKVEQEEGVGLLNAAIEHWSALKNTSPDGLREGFLQRDGKLVILPDGRWELTVESKAQDILLNHLPLGWSVGTVLLPWMKKRLTVNWV